MTTNENDNAPTDICIIGGGINGVGFARDAAGRGLSTALVEQYDLGEGTSSRTGKYIHGGLRYLEHYEFRLVREALKEREVILNIAPHLAKPLRLVLVHSAAQRPAWLVKLGLFLYDRLGGRRRIPGSQSLRLPAAPEGESVRDTFRRGFAYWDVWVDDARLVIANAKDAARKGARILPRRRCVSARREANLWRIQLENTTTGERETLLARALFNAAGPWVEQVIQNTAGVTSDLSVRLVKGSHLIMKKWWRGDHGYVLQAEDRRIIFVNPYFDDLALVGTTDIPYEGRPEDVAMEQNEVDYLLAILNLHFARELNESHIVSRYSGVRPLFDDDASKSASSVTRDYRFEWNGSLQPHGDTPPMLSVFGGKLTTYRKLAEFALEKFRPVFPHMGAPWTARASLPGGDIGGEGFAQWLARFRATHRWLPSALAQHYALCYGNEAEQLLADASSLADLGAHFGGLLYAREAEWLTRHEWAATPEDILLRRAKHHLFLSKTEQAHFAARFHAGDFSPKT